ncbi:MAG: PIG-L family deacetylase [Bryobacteraceae bacterium]
MTEARSNHLSRAAVIAAHPDDETLWCGGYIITHPEFQWRIVTLCRGGDSDRAPKFLRVLESLGAEGDMASLDDEPEQTPLPPQQLRETITGLLPRTDYDLILTHGPNGEYTQHRRHVECSQAVVDLWRSGHIATDALWMFAYEDGGRAYLPRIRDDAHRRDPLDDVVWLEKRRLLTDLYGFGPESWEVRTTPREEGFYCLNSPQAAIEQRECQS